MRNSRQRTARETGIRRGKRASELIGSRIGCFRSSSKCSAFNFVHSTCNSSRAAFIVYHALAHTTGASYKYSTLLPHFISADAGADKRFFPNGHRIATGLSQLKTMMGEKERTK